MVRFSKFRGTLEGHIDEISETGVITGWARSLLNPLERIGITALCGREVLGRASADQYRSDLAELNIGDANYGFEVHINLTKFKLIDETLVIDVVAQNGTPLANSPVSFSTGNLMLNSGGRLGHKRVRYLSSNRDQNRALIDRKFHQFVDQVTTLSNHLGHELGISIFYWTLLQRAPDPPAIKENLIMLAKGEKTMRFIADQIFNSDEFISKNFFIDHAKTLSNLLKLIEGDKSSMTIR